jgi:NADP-dependent 3-hydroxy acid dehydrogenase YdfG
VQITGSRVLLTGATGGLGRAIARALHERGAHLLLNGRKQDALEALCAELGAERAEPLAADLAVRASVEALPSRAGQVDILVHNAGLPGSGRLESYTPEEIDRVLDVNLRSGVVLTRALLPGMTERNRGHLVFMSSMAGKVPLVHASLYSATKFALRGFAGALRDDLHSTGVGVSVVFPGPIEDAGLQADSGVSTPNPKRYARDVADAVVRAIERDKPEVTVADPIQRAGAVLAAVAPGPAAQLRRLIGLERIVEATAEAQREKR